MISYGLPTSHSLVQHSNPHGHETTRRSNVMTPVLTSHHEKEKEDEGERERESDSERETMSYCLIRVSLI